MSKITVLFFWVSFGSHISGSIRSNYLGLMWTQGLKWAPVWTGIAYWWSYFGLNCAQMAPGGVESEFGMQGWIGTVRLKQIFLIFSTLFASHRNELRLTTASYPDVSLSMKMCAQWKEGRRSLPVHHQSLAFRARLYHSKNEAPEEEAGLTMYPCLASQFNYTLLTKIKIEENIKKSLFPVTSLK